MHHKHLSRLLPLGFIAAVTAAVAQVPPIKPGLWQAQVERSVDGKPAADMSERLQKMSPAARQRMETMLKQRGVDASGGGTRVCLTRETLDQGRWNESNPRCKTEFGNRSASAWKWHSVCTQPDSTSDGEAAFHSPESYTMTMNSTVQIKGQPHSSKHVVKMQWLAADCGEVKPLQVAPKR